MTVILSVLAIGALIVIHELGHLIVAKWTGLPATRFSIGMGPVIWKKDAWGVEWALSLVPFGGYVMFDAESEAFEKAPTSAKIWTSLAGPAANVLAALLAYIIAASLAAGALAVVAGVGETWTSLQQMLKVLGMLFTGQVGIKDLAGPVHMVTAGSTLMSDPMKFARYLGFISMNLAVLNLLPIPALDGGQIILTSLQHARGKPLSERAQNVLFGTSWVFLMGVLVWVTGQDIIRQFFT